MVKCPRENCSRQVRIRGLCATHYEYARRRGVFDGVAPDRANTELRYSEKVDRSGGEDACHLWTASVNAAGYGNFRADGKMQLAHRWAFNRFVRKLSDKEVVRHRCDNPPCQNLRHLTYGSPRDNSRDMLERGRAADTRGERNGRAKLNRVQVEEIRASSVPYRELANRYGVSTQLISAVRLGQVWGETA